MAVMIFQTDGAGSVPVTRLVVARASRALEKAKIASLKHSKANPPPPTGIAGRNHVEPTDRGGHARDKADLRTSSQDHIGIRISSGALEAAMVRQPQ